MKYRSYNKEFITATAQILDVFNDIVIDRRDKNSIQKLISVPCVYGNRSRILKSLENGNKTLKIPLTCISMTNLSRDPDRVFEPHRDKIYSSGDEIDYEYYAPIPITIRYELNIVTKYLEDMDQIICNFMPFANPDFYVVWPHPKYPTYNIKSQIIWEGNIPIEYPTDITETDPYRVIATTDFVYKTWVFPGIAENSSPSHYIKRINFSPNIVEIGDDAYGLDRWYDVPYSMSFDDYQDNIIQGLIKPDRNRDNWDLLRVSGGISGYWSDVSALVTGEVLGDHISGNPCYLTTDEGSLLLINDIGYLPLGMSELDYYKYYAESVSGDLSDGVLL